MALANGAGREDDQSPRPEAIMMPISAETNAINGRIVSGPYPMVSRPDWNEYRHGSPFPATDFASSPSLCSVIFCWCRSASNVVWQVRTGGRFADRQCFSSFLRRRHKYHQPWRIYYCASGPDLPVGEPMVGVGVSDEYRSAAYRRSR